MMFLRIRVNDLTWKTKKSVQEASLVAGYQLPLHSAHHFPILFHYKGIIIFFWVYWYFESMA
jgi:hypothetical protein